MDLRQIHTQKSKYLELQGNKMGNYVFVSVSQGGMEAGRES